METTDPKDVVKQYNDYMAKKKHDLAEVSQSARIKCFDMDIVWKLRQFVDDFPAVKLTIDADYTHGWFFKTKEVQFTISGPRVDVRLCVDRIETAIEKYMERLLNA